MTPRIAPGTRREIGALNWGIARLLGIASGSSARRTCSPRSRAHRRLFRPWLRFAGALMPGGVLPRADTELVILRVAHNCGCDYEWRHHERIGAARGTRAEDDRSASRGAARRGLDGRARRCCCGPPTSCTNGDISDELWASCAPR